MGDEEWVKVATGDDTMVAELLVRLRQVKHPTPPPPPPPPGPTSKPALSLEWSVRQRRSKAVVVQAFKQAPGASPTTPLSWSGATSVSGGGGSGSGGSFDGGPEEESGRPKRPDTSRSKVIGTSEATNSKKSRRKKTLAELREEEDLLEKERRQLKRELATLRVNLERERARNENYKRMKIDLHKLPAVKIGRTITSELDISNQLLQKLASLDTVSALLPLALASSGGSLPSPPSSSCNDGNEEAAVGKFALPDLNIPFEENSSCVELVSMDCGGHTQMGSD